MNKDVSGLILAFFIGILGGQSTASTISPQASKQDISRIVANKKPMLLLKRGFFELDPQQLPTIKEDGDYIYLQLKGNLTKAKQAQLKQLGVRLEEYLPYQTWIAFVESSGTLFGLQSLPFVYAMGKIDVRDKIDPSLPVKQGQTTLLVGERKSPHHYHLVTLAAEEILAFASQSHIRWIEDKPLPVIPANINAAKLSSITKVQTDPLNLTGDGIKLGQWEQGFPENHIDFEERVKVIQESQANWLAKKHATHVAGTIIGSGKHDRKAKGIAPKAELFSYTFGGASGLEKAVAEISKAIRDENIFASNHSYRIPTGWRLYDFGYFGFWKFTDNQHLFGEYSAVSESLDHLIHQTNHVYVKAAGNDRVDIGDGTHPADGGESGYDTITDGGVSKNGITVGAVNQAVKMSSFSSWGPTNDGRIKPDLMADGVDVYSTINTSSYIQYSGTSMAAPVVTGSVALLGQHYKALFQTLPSASLVKALLIAGAKDTEDTGPDYKSGWGILNLETTIKLIEKTKKHFMEPLFEQAGETKTFSITADETAQSLTITTVWTDPAANPSAALSLINDFDTVLIDPKGNQHLPWVTDGSHPDKAASKGVNRVDNVEQIIIEKPEAKTWQLRITAPANLKDKQIVSIVSTGEIST